MRKDKVITIEKSEAIGVFELVLGHPEAPLIINIMAIAILSWKALDIFRPKR